MNHRHDVPTDDEPLDEIADDAAEHNPDPTTRREAFEQELMEEGRSQEGAKVGDVDDSRRP